MRAGLTLVESLVVVVMIGVLSATLWPSLSSARSSARVGACAAQLRQVGVAMTYYTLASRHRLPPFLFSEKANPSLPLSGHYGGSNGEFADFLLSRTGDADVNLHALRREELLTGSNLICPGASRAIQDRQAGYFHGGRFSTYGIRMPYSLDIWPGQAPPLPGYDTLFAYRRAAGGQMMPDWNNHPVQVPQLRVDRLYASDLPGGATFDPASDAIVSDAFTDRDYRDESGQVDRRWCHGGRFNVLLGSGAVRVAKDDGTVSTNASPPGTTRPVDDHYNASYAEAIWRFFDTVTH